MHYSGNVIEQRCIEIETLNEILPEILRLPPVEALVIILWCGLHGGKPWTIRQLAKRLAVSRGEIQNFKAQALERLRAKARIYEPRGQRGRHEIASD